MHRRTLVIIATVAMVTLAGCNGANSVLGESGPVVSHAQVDVVEGYGPAIVFNYSINDYSTILLEGPNNEIVDSKKLSPDNNRSRIDMGVPRKGEYRLILKQGDKTKTEKSVTYTGPDPVIKKIDAKWSGSSVESVTVTLANEGDLPLGVVNASYSARNQSVNGVEIRQWVESNETTTFEIASSYANTVTIEQPGDVRGTVSVRTINDTVTGTFEKSFQGANLTVTGITDFWDHNTLTKVNVKVKNTGDLPTTANVSVGRNDDMNGPTANKTIAPGQTKKFELGSIFLNIGTVEAAGKMQFDVIVDSPSGYVSDTFTHEIEAPDVTLNSMRPLWNEGRLTKVQFSAHNNGELASDFTATLTVNGKTVYQETGQIDAQTTEKFEIYSGTYDSALYTVTEGGQYDIKLQLEGEGWNTSQSQTVTFEGPHGQIRSIDTFFVDDYDSNSSTLSSLSFTLQNGGDVPLKYDQVEVEINGATSTDSTIYTSLAPGESRFMSPFVDISVPDGSHQLTIRLLNGGKVVAETTKTVSTSS